MVAFQAAFAIMAEQFPGAFSGYKLEVCTLSYRFAHIIKKTSKFVILIAIIIACLDIFFVYLS